METDTPPRAPWLDAFTEREQKSIDHARLYTALYDHGDPGHLHLNIIAKLAKLLDERDGISVVYAIDRTLEVTP